MRVLTASRFTHCWHVSILLLLVCSIHSVTAAEKSDVSGKPGPPATDDSREAGNWTSFRNGKLQQGIAESTLPAELELLWQHTSSDGIASTAAIVGNRVYMAGLNG
ncbi:MAG TPA: serine/threonine protein kinase, partial [Planctomycetaceae bacterium]|nr:serine/threonine protein kinase [Planctomycetaceae bacterium]